MTPIKSISVISQGSFLLFAFLLFLSVAAIIFMYKSTIPPVASWRKFLLAAVRFCALLAIIGIIFSPVLKVSYEDQQKPNLAIVIDTSSSMNNSLLSDREQSQDDNLQPHSIINALQSADIQALTQSIDLNYYQFDRVIQSITENDLPALVFEGEGTDISSVLRTVIDRPEENTLGIVLITDGMYNIGENPAYMASLSNTPVFPVLIGDPTPKKDVLITDIQMNEITYTDEEIPITVTVQSSGYEGRSAAVQLFSADNELLDSETIFLGSDFQEQTIVFHYTPKLAGVQTLHVSVPSFENEVSVENNNQDIHSKVLESKLKILITAGRPSLDFSFMKRSLESVDDFTVTSLVLKPEGSYLENTAAILDSIHIFHLFIFIDFPAEQSSDALVQALRSEIAEKNKPVLYMSGPSLSPVQLQNIADMIAVRNLAQQGNEIETFLKLSEDAFNHPVFQISDDLNTNRIIWSTLPPIYTPGMIPIPFNDAEIMANVDIVRAPASSSASTTPLMFLRKVEERKSLFLNIYTMWRWKFMLLRDSEKRDFYDIFLMNCVQWLINSDDNKQVSVATNKEFYRNGESITVSAQVYTPNYEPVDNAEVQISVKKAESEFSRILLSTGNGHYSSSLTILEPGNYTLSTSALLNDRIIGSDATDFFIDNFNIEHLKTTSDSLLLTQVAAQSGGALLKTDKLSKLTEYLDTSPIVMLKTITLQIWNTAWLLVVIVFLLCLEWFLRKRMGML